MMKGDSDLKDINEVLVGGDNYISGIFESKKGTGTGT